MARRTVLVCDSCGKEVGENKGAALRVTFTDARRGSKVADLCDPCAAKCRVAPLRAAAGRPKSAAPDAPESAPAGSERLDRGSPRSGLRFATAAANSAPAPFPARRRPDPSGRTTMASMELGHGSMGLSLLAGPANAGKVALLLERYLARLDDEPFLIVPNRADVDRVERDLLARCGCLLGGAIGTFDDLFAADRRAATRAAAGRDGRAASADRAPRGRRASARRRDALARSARFAGFVDALLGALGELESGLLDPAELDGEVGRALRRLPARARPGRALGPRPAPPPRQPSGCGRELDAWHGEPVFAYGFEDLTAAEWSLLEALAGRAEVDVSLPYEPGRAAFASLAADRRGPRRARRGRIEELPPRSAEFAAPALARLERTLFEPRRRTPAADRRRGPFLEGAGTRGTLELVGEEVLDAASRRHARPSRSRSSCRRSSAGARRSRPCSATLGIPYAIEARVRLAVDAARARAALAAAVRLGGRRPRASCTRSCARRTRASRARASTSPRGGCADVRSRQPERVEEETERLREAPLVALRELRDAASPVEGVRALARLDGARRLRARRAARRRHVAARPALRRGGRRGCSTSSRAGSGSARRSRRPT